MGNLYQLLKGKVEGSSLDGKSSQGRKNQLGGSTGGKQGMVDALAEITRWAYFQQIEEDAQKYATSIIEMKVVINSFKTKDMAELLKFHQYVELHMEDLTDEAQVSTRFKDFPIKKLETLRAGEVDALERKKDEESKQFQDYGELMVDVSSRCMELAHEERRENDNQSKASTDVLWRVFQLAFWVYTFAGGEDDRVDKLSKELVHEIETIPQHK
uniref:Uncharacterized protein n=1 Tax=Nelumbo nucifera TaxID=4432 RepID=A0A822ZVF0_NELNU|nr:TPA_asm: hypothetical protein HUJ06_004118 [Nelumbo nucifera]